MNTISFYLNKILIGWKTDVGIGKKCYKCKGQGQFIYTSSSLVLDTFMVRFLSSLNFDFLVFARIGLYLIIEQYKEYNWILFCFDL